MSKKSSSTPPVVLVPACNRVLGQHPFHVAGRKYVDAVRLAGALPLVVPAVRPEELDTLLDLAHGVLLTGSPSNVDPTYYGEAVHNPALPLDPDRDVWILPFIRKVLERGMPLLGICRGAQETNVALGGSLTQAVQECAGRMDHRAPHGETAERQYAPAHTVRVRAGGWMAGWFGPEAELQVNSVHGQGVARLADGLRVEALAPDGLIEAFSVADHPGFGLCVQWHPEWRAADNPVSMTLLHAFGAACQNYRDTHRPPSC